MTSRRARSRPPERVPLIPAEGHAAIERSLSAGTNPVRVIVICDMLLLRAGIRHILQQSGIQVLSEANTYQEALQLAGSAPPDIVLIDVDSPAGEYDNLRALAEATPHSRIIALADEELDLNHPILVEFGGMGVVMKRQAPEQLIKAIMKVHAGEFWWDRIHTADLVNRLVRRRRSEDVENTKIATLTKREHEIVRLGEGLKNSAIGERLFISEATVRNHLTSILDKLGLADRFELAVYAFKNGLVHYDRKRLPPDSR
jgi:DNA-binding NarL/FixJ family response regulator